MKYLGSILMLVGAPMLLMVFVLKSPLGVNALGDLGWYPYAIAAAGVALVFIGYRIDRARH